MFFVEDIGVARVVHVFSDRIEGILCDHALEISFSSGNGRNSSSFFFFCFFFSRGDGIRNSGKRMSKRAPNFIIWMENKLSIKIFARISNFRAKNVYIYIICGIVIIRR